MAWVVKRSKLKSKKKVFLGHPILHLCMNGQVLKGEVRCARCKSESKAFTVGPTKSYKSDLQSVETLTIGTQDISDAAEHGKNSCSQKFS